MKTKTPSLHKELLQRVNSGEGKSAIFRDYAGTELENRVAKSLALIATPENRKKAAPLTFVLLFFFGILTIIKFYAISILFPTLPIAGALIAVFLAGLVNLGIIYCVLTHNFIGYVLLVCFGFNGLAKMPENFRVSLQPEMPLYVLVLDCASLICCIVSMILAFILYRKLFPCASFFFAPKRDACGNPIFEN